MGGQECSRRFFTLIVCFLAPGATLAVVYAEEAEQDDKSKPRHPWIHVRKDGEGKLVAIEADAKKIPKDIIRLLTPKKDEQKLNRDKIRELAKKHKLLALTDVNPHLRFKDGDISYWAEQNLAAWELELEFLARRLVLEVADRDEAVVPTQGDLSHWATKLYVTLYKKASENWMAKRDSRE